MCGFAGEFLIGSGRADPGIARAMSARLVHRGPDRAGHFISKDSRCTIGFRRLAVIDPAGSDQPMSLPDESLTVAFNGEIYNFRSLRRTLASDGAKFKSNGDTEVLLHLYRRYGPAMVDHLDGMFAFVIYDAEAGTLFLARDRIGQKPLWYSILYDRIVFASEAKALLLHPKVSRHVERHSITSYFSIGYIPSPQSAWRGVLKMQPGHCMLVPDDPGPQRYWAPTADTNALSEDQAIEKVRATLTEAVEARMKADVPLGALLSGGVDSAVVVALMSKAAGRVGGVRTFTAGFEDDSYDERPGARAIADHCGAQHTELLIKPEAGALLDRIVDLYDEPFADSSALPTFLICQAARQHVTVALVGDGGDEVFGGYDRYRALHLAESMGWAKYFAARVMGGAFRLIAPVHERNLLRRFVRFTEALGRPFSVQYLMYRSLFAKKDLSRLLTDDFASSLDLDGPADWFYSLYEQGDFDDEVGFAQRHDVLTYLPDDLLVKADIASMASSLELRAPMLDHRLVDLGLSLPTKLKLSRRRGKTILAKAFGDILPKKVFTGRKRGFAVPLARWLREDLRETLRETLLDKQLQQEGIFRPEALAGLINDHLSEKDDHSHRLWSLLVFARWLNRQR